MTLPIISVVGWHNVGKTTVIERLVAELKRRGLRVATVKHTRGDFALDQPGSDTYRFAQAGSDIVVIAGQDQIAFIERRDEMMLDEIVARLPRDLDLVIVEGFKRAAAPKIEVWGPEEDERIARPEDLLAIVSRRAPADCPANTPCFSPDDIIALADFLRDKGLITR